MVREPPDERDERAALAKMYLLEAVNGTDEAALETFVAEDGPESPFGETRSIEPTIRDGLDTADLRVDVVQTVTEGEWVAIRGIVRSATDRLPPRSGDERLSVSVDCVWFVHVHDEQIEAVWALPDTLALRRQLEADQQHP